jgi:uncharacterized protein (TIGR02598 family)
MRLDSNNMNTSLHPQGRSSAFSLVEVVVAVGIFAISIVAVIGLLGPTNKSVAEVRDSDDATRVVSAIQAELQNISISSTGFTNVGSYLQATAPVDPADGVAYTTSYKAYTFYASRDASKIALGNDTRVPPIFPDNKQKYFEIVLIRNTTLSPSTTTDQTSGFIAYTMRLRWPAYNPDGSEFTGHTQKNVLLVPGAVHR